MSITASGYHPHHLPATKARTVAEPPPEVPKLPVKRPTITGHVEKMMKVRLLSDRADGLLGVCAGVMDTGHWVLDLDGRPTGAAAAVIFDNTLAMSLRTSAVGLNWLVTTELNLNFMRPLPTDGTVLEAWTRTLVSDKAGGMATGTLQGPDGTEYVQGTGWFQRAEGNTPEGLDRFKALARQPLGEEEGASLGALLASGPPAPTLPGDRPAFARTLFPASVLPARTSSETPKGPSTAAH